MIKFLLVLPVVVLANILSSSFLNSLPTDEDSPIATLSTEEFLEDIDELNSELNDLEEQTGLSKEGLLLHTIEIYAEALTDIDEQLDSFQEIDEQCQTMSDCSDCIREDSCIWCIFDNTCYAGTTNGPYFANCPTFVLDFCYTTCELNQSFEDCWHSYGCGWCDGACIEDTDSCTEEALVNEYLLSYGQEESVLGSRDTDDIERFAAAVDAHKNIATNLYILNESLNYYMDNDDDSGITIVIDFGEIGEQDTDFSTSAEFEPIDILQNSN